MRHVRSPGRALGVVCATRDVTGRYAGRRAGESKSLTGVDDPYKAPTDPDLVIPTHTQNVAESLAILRAALPR